MKCPFLTQNKTNIIKIRKINKKEQKSEQGRSANIHEGYFLVHESSKFPKYKDNISMNNHTLESMHDEFMGSFCPLFGASAHCAVQWIPDHPP